MVRLIFISYCFLFSSFFLNQQRGIAQYIPGRNSNALLLLAHNFRNQNKNDSLKLVQYSQNWHFPLRTVDARNNVSEFLGFTSAGFPIIYSTQNFNAALTTSTEAVWPAGLLNYNLTGENITIGMWDAGAVRTTHQEFDNRVEQKDGATWIISHATHVAGTLAASGQNNNAKGMASSAKIDAYDWNKDNAEMTLAAENGLLLSNHSYGMNVGWYYNYGYWFWLGDISISDTEDYKFGFYNEASRAWDLIAFNAPYYLIVKSAGNERGSGPPAGTGHYYWSLEGNVGRWVYSTDVRALDGGEDGYDCLDNEAVSKNILTVGAVGDISSGYHSPSDVIMTIFSSWGPTDDGRIKPDIVANGTNLLSATSGSDESYAYMTGTSQAAPNVTGSLALLQQLYQRLHTGKPMRASTLKGVVIHTADEAGESNGPDYKFGWGLLNIAKAAEVIQDGSTNLSNHLVKELTLISGKEISFYVECSGNNPLRATICWTDPPGSPLPPLLNPGEKKLLNDLDLRLYKDSDTFFPWTLDPQNPDQPPSRADNNTDNVEQVHIRNPQPGIYRVTISHKDTLLNGYQNFALILSGGSFEKKIAVRKPNGGEAWVAGSYRQIEWTSMNLSDSVKIDLSDDAGLNWKNIVAKVPNTGKFNWLIEPHLSNECIVKVSSCSDGILSDESDNLFSITNLDSVRNLRIIRVSNALELLWSTVKGAKRYNIYRSTNPAFSVNSSNYLSTCIDTSFIDQDNDLVNDIIGNLNSNYFYIVRAANLMTQGGDSKRVGEYDFKLVSNSRGDMNEISLCLWNDNLRVASDLIREIPGVISVSHWDVTKQSFFEYNQNNPESDFLIYPGQGIRLKISKNDIFTLVGEVVQPHFDLKTTAFTDFNSIFIPLLKTDIKRTDQLLNRIPNCNSIACWDSDKQRLFQYTPSVPQTNFVLKPGMPLYVNITKNCFWK